MIATPTHVPLSLIKSPFIKRASCFAGGAFLTLFLTVACRQAPNSTDQTSTLDAGLIAHWSFESTSNPGEDVSGNEHHGRAEDTVSIVPGRVGDALNERGLALSEHALRGVGTFRPSRGPRVFVNFDALFF